MGGARRVPSIALAAQDPDTAQRHIDAMRPVLDGGPQADQTHYWHFQAGLALLRGETAVGTIQLVPANCVP